MPGILPRSIIRFNQRILLQLPVLFQQIRQFFDGQGFDRCPPATGHVGRPEKGVVDGLLRASTAAWKIGEIWSLGNTPEREVESYGGTIVEKAMT